MRTGGPGLGSERERRIKALVSNRGRSALSVSFRFVKVYPKKIRVKGTGGGWGVGQRHISPLRLGYISIGPGLSFSLHGTLDQPVY